MGKTIEITDEDYSQVIEIDDGVAQVCMNGVETPPIEGEKSLVVAEHMREEAMQALNEDDEIYASGWKKRVIVITGASDGIGLEAARRFTLYADVVYNLDMERQDDDNINFIKTDITNPESVNLAIQKIWDKEEQIDILINNAGIGFAGSAEHATLDQINRVIGTNFIGTCLVTSAVIPLMRERRRGTIMNLASQTGISNKKFQSIYNSSKSAVLAYSATLKEEVRPFGIKVTAILLGNIKSSFTEERIKNVEDNVYKYRFAKAISRAEFDEQSGKETEWVARKLFTLSNKKFLKPITVFGAKYRMKLFFRKFSKQRVKG